MDNPLAMQFGKRVGDLQPIGEGVSPGQLAVLFNQAREGGALDQFHDQVMDLGFGVEIAVIHLDDVGMVGLGAELGLAVKAGDRFGVGGSLGREHLERDLAPDGALFGGVDHSERTGTEALFEHAAADLAADQTILGPRERSSNRDHPPAVGTRNSPAN